MKLLFVLVLVAAIAGGQALETDRTLMTALSNFGGTVTALLNSVLQHASQLLAETNKSYENQVRLTQAKDSAATDLTAGRKYWEGVKEKACAQSTEQARKQCEAANRSIQMIDTAALRAEIGSRERKTRIRRRTQQELNLEEDEDINEFHVVVRAFIPGAGTRAGRGHDNGMTLGRRATFPGYNLPTDASKSYAGYTVGIYELDEIFDTNHRDFSTSIRANDHSKTHVYMVFKKESGTWTVPSKTRGTFSNGSSRTHHYCDGNWAQAVGGWPTGLCCNHKRGWGASEGFSMAGSQTGNSFTFRVDVTKGNPCVPGSTTLGPIQQQLDFTVDTSRRRISYTGTKSQFPALEVCWGLTASSLTCHQYDVAGRDFFDLSFPDNTVNENGRF